MVVSDFNLKLVDLTWNGPVVNDAQSEWTEVYSGVPQGSVLGPILFTIYINDLDDEIKRKILKFADDTKLTGRVSNDKQRQIIKEDLIVLSNWAKVWEMPFNIDQYKVMHIGNSKFGSQIRDLWKGARANQTGE